MTTRRRVIVPSAAALLFAIGIAINADTKDAKLTVGRPAVWTLEQAHYLLARQRRTNLDLETKKLTGDDLNPNAVNSSRLDALRTMFSVDAGYSQERGLENQDATGRRNDLRRQRADLTRQLNGYRSQQLRLIREMGDLQIQAAKLDPDTDKIDLAVKNAEIGAKKSQLDVVEKRIDAASTQIADVDKGLDTPLSLKGFESSAAAALPESVVEKTLTDALDPGATRIQASAALDNYIQMQYELIAKQLSLLRDDLGRENRLVFLELPVSAYTSPKAKDVLIRTTWRIEGLIQCGSGVASGGVPEQDVRFAKVCPQTAAPQVKDEAAARSRQESINELFRASRETIKANVSRIYAQSTNRSAIAPPPVLDRAAVEDASQTASNRVALADRSNTHVIDLFPRQSALNVNTVHDEVHNVSLAGLLSLVGGFGAKTQFERQRELFQNYIQQDIFAAGFGKGDTTFGWTFGPLPGSRQVASGVKVTYAAIVIPRQIQAITLRGSACPFKRNDVPSGDPFAANVECDVSEPFDLALPTTDEGFTPTAINYATVSPGDTATMVIRGDYFSPQIGVLVNGSPLMSRALGLAQTDLDSTLATASADQFSGEFEYVNSTTLVLRVKGSNTLTSTPRIVVITPTSATGLNDQMLAINGHQNTLDALDATGNGLFHASMAIASARVASASKASGTVAIDLTGDGFTNQTQFDINGDPVRPVARSGRTVRVELTPNGAPTWEVTANEPGTSLFANYSTANALLLKKTGGEVIASVPAAGKSKARLIVKLGAQSLNEKMGDAISVVGGSLDDDTVAMSPTEAVIEIEEPKDTVVVRLDRVLGDLRQVLTWTFNRKKGQPDEWTVK